MFEIKLNETVEEKVTGIRGKVIGRAEYVFNDSLYLVRWKNENGTASEEWFTANQLKIVED